MEEGKEEEDKEEDEVEDLSMNAMHQKGLGKRNNDDNCEGRRGVARSGSQGSEGPGGRQQISTKPKTIPLKSKQDEDQPPYKVIYKVHYTTLC